jgi:hypothetical protein
MNCMLRASGYARPQVRDADTRISAVRLPIAMTLKPYPLGEDRHRSVSLWNEVIGRKCVSVSRGRVIPRA